MICKTKASTLRPATQDKGPKFQDIVKHKTADVSGTVIAKYVIEGEQYLDVREGTEKIYWETPAKNWETVIAYEE